MTKLWIVLILAIASSMIAKYLVTAFVIYSSLSTVYCQDDFQLPIYQQQRANQYKLGLRYRIKQNAKALPGEHKADLKRLYKSKYKSSLYLTDYKHFYFAEEWNSYLDDILKTILSSNPTIDDDVNIVLSTYFWPNAFSLGEGTIVLNPGLVPELQNEDQLAYVICHELSHYLLRHSESIYLDYVANWNSTRLKKQIRDYSDRYSYENDRLKQLLRTKLYNSLQHKRMYEYQADSLGMELYNNTPYDKKEALYTIQILDDLDAKNKREVDVIEVTNFQHVKIDDQKILSKSKSKGTWLEFDSLKTHPECSDRYDRLNALFGLTQKPYKNDISTNSGQEDFLAFQRDMIYFRIDNYQKYNRYDLALLAIWDQQAKGDDNLFLDRQEFYLLCELAYARKKHRIGQYCTLPHDSMDRDQYTLNAILFEQRYKTFVEEIHTFAMNNYNEEFTDERTVYSLGLLAYVAGDKELLDDIKSDYYVKFGRTKYYETIKYLYL